MNISPSTVSQLTFLAHCVVAHTHLHSLLAAWWKFFTFSSQLRLLGAEAGGRLQGRLHQVLLQVPPPHPSQVVWALRSGSCFPFFSFVLCTHSHIYWILFLRPTNAYSMNTNCLKIHISFAFLKCFFSFLVWRQTHAYSINTPVVEETQTHLSLRRWRWWRTWCWCWWWSCVADEEWGWSCTGDNLLKVLFSGVPWQMRWRRDNPVHTRPGQKSSSDIFVIIIIITPFQFGFFIRMALFFYVMMSDIVFREPQWRKTMIQKE